MLNVCGKAAAGTSVRGHLSVFIKTSFSKNEPYYSKIQAG
jgi:hypothetical protein